MREGYRIDADVVAGLSSQWVVPAWPAALLPAFRRLRRGRSWQFGSRN
jgi:hypothetical protein